MTSETLLAKYPIISDQVTRADLSAVLTELEKALNSGIAGDVVEFGCYVGTTSLFIRRLLDKHHARGTFHVYDSFAGLPEKSRQDESVAGSNFQAGQLAISKKLFIHEFQKAHLRLPVIHKGWFSELKPADVPEHIAFAFLDGDFYESIRSSLKLVLPRMSSSGTIVVHDYTREALPGVQAAVAEQSLRVRVQGTCGIIRC